MSDLNEADATNATNAINDTNASTSAANHEHEAAVRLEPSKQKANQPSLSPDVPEKALMSIDPALLPFTLQMNDVQVEVYIPRDKTMGQRDEYPCKAEINPDGYNAAWNDGTKKWKAPQSQPRHVYTTKAVFSPVDDQSTEVVGNLFCTSPQIDGVQKNFVVPAEVAQRCYSSVYEKYKAVGKYHIMCEDGNDPFSQWETHNINIPASIKRFGWSYVNPSKNVKDSDDEFDEDDEPPPAPPPKSKVKKAEKPPSNPFVAPRQPSPPPEAAETPMNVDSEAPLGVADEATEAAAASQEFAPDTAPDNGKKPQRKPRGPSKKKLAEEAAAAAAVVGANQPDDSTTTTTMITTTTNAGGSPASRKRPASQAESSSKRQVSEIKESDLAFFGGDTGILSKLQEAYDVGWGCDKSFKTITFDFTSEAEGRVLIVKRETAN